MRNATDTKWPYTWATGLFAIATPAQAPDFRAGKPGYAVNDYWVELPKHYGDQTGKKVAVFASDDPDGVGWQKEPGRSGPGFVVLRRRPRVTKT
jgi:hypothetical protein